MFQRMSAAIWVYVLAAVCIASPAIEILFPETKPFPSCSALALQTALSLLVDDCCFYCYHRCFHAKRWLYVRFHKQHHAFSAPCVWSSHAVHPVEMMLQVFDFADCYV